jgi:hypothetical protein
MALSTNIPKISYRVQIRRYYLKNGALEEKHTGGFSVFVANNKPAIDVFREWRHELQHTIGYPGSVNINTGKRYPSTAKKWFPIKVVLECCEEL